MFGGLQFTIDVLRDVQSRELSRKVRVGRRRSERAGFKSHSFDSSPSLDSSATMSLSNKLSIENVDVKGKRVLIRSVRPATLHWHKLHQALATPSSHLPESLSLTIMQSGLQRPPEGWHRDRSSPDPVRGPHDPESSGLRR